MRGRLLYLTRCLLLTVLTFVTAKVVFMLCHAADHPFAVGDVLDVVRHGLSLDLSTALYFLIVPFLLTVASMWIRVPRWLFRSYYILIAVAFVLAFVADTSLYTFWQFKLDASCLSYLATPTEAMSSVSTGYLLLRLLLLVVLTALVALAYCRMAGQPPHGRGSWREALLDVLLVPLFVIGIRGGLGESTTNIGQVYYSQEQFLNHAAVNPVFSFLYSLGKSGDYIVEYTFYEDSEYQWLTDGIFQTQSTGCDTLLTTRRPNILLIIMESCGGQFTEIGGRDDITPNLNSLAREGVYFTECYANSWRTDKGVVSILSGYPAFPITSVMKVPEKSRKLPSLARSLSSEGYSCSFLYGGDINFTNMRSYVMGSGYGQLTWKADYSLKEQSSAKWGVEDGITARSVLEQVARQPSSPWMLTWLTLSSHEPWDVPVKHLDDEVENAFYYLDSCIERLITQLRQSPAWNDLLVIILPDHGYRYKGVNETTRLFNHIPMIWVGGAVREPRRIDHICNQSDLAATLLGQMGIQHDEYTFSRDVLSDTYQRRTAFHTYVNGMTVFDSTGFMSYDLGAEQMVAAEGNDSTRLLRLGRALLQLTSHDLISK
jgi:phosphoglycerol transferase MdoB-like AlkP superfamily enzyme